MFDDALAVDQFLRQESRGGQHGQAPVLEFLGLHQFEFVGIGGFESEGIETEVSGDVRFAEETWFIDGHVLGFDPPDLGADRFGLGDTGSEEEPEDGIDLREVGDGRTGDLPVEEERLALHSFADQETDRGQHGNATVGEFGLAVSLEGGFVGLGGKAGGVEQTDGFQGTGDVIDGEGLSFTDGKCVWRSMQCV